MSCSGGHKICEGCGADFSFLDKMKTKTKKRKNRKGKSVEDTEDDPKIREALKVYYDRFRETEGFDVPDPPCGTFLCISRVDDLEDDDILEQARFAVDAQNEEKGTKLEFVKIVKAMKQGVGGILYYLTIEVKDIDGIIKTYQAKTLYTFSGNVLKLFREPPCN